MQDDAFCVIRSKHEPQNTKENTTVSEAAGNIALPAAPVRGNPRPTKFLSTQRQKKTYRVRYKLWCQISTFQDYPNLQNFLKEKEFHTTLYNLTIPSHTEYEPTVFLLPSLRKRQHELHGLGLAVQNAVPMITGETRRLSVHII